VTRQARAPILLVGAAFTSAWRLRSWDRFYLPKPFSRVSVRCVAVESTPGEDREASAQAIATRLRELNPDSP
jgi:lysophospholipid acyltransferase (LPLAT)-like uncharacterized protein